MLKIVVFSVLLWTIECSRILGIFPTPDVNHFLLGSQLIEALAKNGHQVTMVSPFTPEWRNENLTSVEIKQEMELETVSKFTDNINMNFISSTTKLYGEAYETTEALLSDPTFQLLLQSGQKYDLIIAEYFMNEALFGLSSHFNAPIILLSPLPSSSLMNELFANPAPSAFIPNILSGHTGIMGFGGRLHNFFCNVFNKHYKYYVALPKQEKLLNKYINRGASIHEAIEDISLVLLNSHSSITEPVPHTPNMVEIGGMHITSPKPLPEDLDHFLRKASGVVYFALNSALKSSVLGRDKVVDILRGFRMFAKLSVVWNLDVDEDIGEVPENVMIVGEISHQDILAQENVVAFITDGNLLRIFEAVYYKKPIVGVPLIEDQKSNIARAVQDGYGVELPFAEMSGYRLFESIMEVLKNGRYSFNVRQKSKLLKDQLVSPLKTAVFWTEYVIRHGGARHFQSPGVYLPIFKRHLIDIIIVLTIIDIILFLIFYYIFKHIIHLAKRKYKERKNRSYQQMDRDNDKE